MVMNWMVGSSAVTGDISQFYNTVRLEEKHWAFQQVFWYDDLDPNSPLRRGVVGTLIYGVRCVKGQTETTMDLVAEPHKETLPCVYDLIARLRYVDDMGKGNKTDAESKKLRDDTDRVLNSVGMKVKGWAQSGEIPSPEISDDGTSVMFAGLVWTPLIDVYSLNIDRLHFGKKKRGRFSPDLIKYDGSFGTSIEEFVPK